MSERSKLLFVERGYGQVEANRLSGITFGNIEAQAPAYEVDEDGISTTPIAELENGMFLCVIPDKKENGSKGAAMGRIAVLPGNAPNAVPYLVYSEKKIYDERLGYCDFVDKAADKVDGLLFPRLIGITPDSCVFTTNTINCAANAEISVGDIAYIGDDGYLRFANSENSNHNYWFEVVKVYTMPDGQRACKFQAKKFVETKKSVESSSFDSWNGGI